MFDKMKRSSVEDRFLIYAASTQSSLIISA
jgi:hypothetical protein